MADGQPEEKRGFLHDFGLGMRNTFWSTPKEVISLIPRLPGREALRASADRERAEYDQHRANIRGLEAPYREEIKPELSLSYAGNTLNSAVRGAANAASFGVANRLQAATDAMTTGEPYEEMLARQQAYDKNGGGAYVVGGIAGAVATGKIILRAYTLPAAVPGITAKFMGYSQGILAYVESARTGIMTEIAQRIDRESAEEPVVTPPPATPPGAPMPARKPSSKDIRDNLL